MSAHKTSKNKSIPEKMKTMKHDPNDTKAQINNEYRNNAEVMYDKAEEIEKNFINCNQEKIQSFKTNFEELKKTQNENILIQNLENEKNKLLKNRL